MRWGAPPVASFGGANYGEKIYRRRFSCAGKRRFRAGAEHEFLDRFLSHAYRGAKRLSHAEGDDKVHRH